MLPPGAHAWDDELEFNTQCSSQWDSLVHVQHQASGMAYNGLKPTQEGLTSPQLTSDNELPTLDHWHSRGGLVGRGVLIDFKEYMDSQGMPYHCLDGHRITVEEMEAVAKHQGVEFRRGDILIVRTGITEIWENPTPEAFVKMQEGTLSGLHGAEETARWLWNKHFAAVAGDSQSCEAYPPLKPDGTAGTAADLCKLFDEQEPLGYILGRIISRLTTHISPSPILPRVVWDAPGRVVGPEGAICLLQEDWEVHFHAHVGSP